MPRDTDNPFLKGLQEAGFVERLHPRGRGGKWVEKLVSDLKSSAASSADMARREVEDAAGFKRAAVAPPKGRGGQHRVSSARRLSTPEKHQLKIARDTLRMSDFGARTMGGPNKDEARATIKRLTGKDTTGVWAVNERTGQKVDEPLSQWDKDAGFPKRRGRHLVTNAQALARAFDGRKGRSGTITVDAHPTEPNTLVVKSYAEPIGIVEPKSKTLYRNTARYSVTTSQQQTGLVAAAAGKGFKVKDVDRGEALRRAGMPPSRFTQLPPGAERGRHFVRSGRLARRLGPLPESSPGSPEFKSARARTAQRNVERYGKKEAFGDSYADVDEDAPFPAGEPGWDRRDALGALPVSNDAVVAKRRDEIIAAERASARIDSKDAGLPWKRGRPGQHAVSGPARSFTHFKVGDDEIQRWEDAVAHARQKGKREVMGIDWDQSETPIPVPRTEKQQARFDAATRRAQRVAQDRHRRIQSTDEERWADDGGANQRHGVRGEPDDLASKVKTMPLHDIARLVRQDWGSKVYFGAVPYLDAMGSLRSVDDKYGLDPGDDIVAYFLSNANTWRGPTARVVKAELKRRIK